MKNTVTKEQVMDLFNKSEIKITTVGDKCTVVYCELPNGFIMVEHSACVDPANYNEQLGYEICKNQIINKIWELEGYRLQDKLYKENGGKV